MHEVQVNRLGGQSLPRKSVVRLTDRLNMTLDVYRGRKITTQQQQPSVHIVNIVEQFWQLVTIYTQGCHLSPASKFPDFSLIFP